MKVERDIVIEAPPARVYAVLMDPRCLNEWVTIHKQLVEAPEGDLREGSKLTQKLKVAGRSFTVHWEVTEVQEPGQVVWSGRGPMRTKARIRYQLEPTEAGTRFTYLNEFELPGGALGKIAGRAVSRAAERETERTLAKLKAFVEGT